MTRPEGAPGHLKSALAHRTSDDSGDSGHEERPRLLAMRILLVARTAAYLPNFRPVLASLAERGHELRVALEEERERVPGQLALVDDLAAMHPGVSRGRAPVRADRLAPMASELRRGLEYLRYREPLYAGSTWLRAHARKRAPARMRRLLGAAVLSHPRARLLAAGVLAWLERALPVPTELESFLRAERPDLVAVTPLVSAGGSQTDFVRAARRLGIPTAGWVYSWDNLTSKGAIHEPPDRLMVWNDAQRREATELHAIPADRVVVTGAQAFDHWFDWEPSTSREQFAARAGLRPDRPFVLYLGSSGGGLGLEAPFVSRWIAAMRSSQRPRLQDASVLVRPHPHASLAQWDALAEQSVGDAVSVFPRGGEQPNNVQTRADFFDSIYHSAAVAGVNTSAFIESAIVGRPVLTVPSPEFRHAQLGTLHFSYFLDEGGGLLSMTDSLDDHLHELDAALASTDGSQHLRQRFLTAFVRPYGLDQPATPRFVAAIEELGRQAPAPARRRGGGPAARVAVEAVGRALDLEVRTRGLRRKLRRRGLRPLRRRLSRLLRRRRRRLGRRLRRATGHASAGLRSMRNSA